MKVEKISKKLIKPHTPTPQNLKNYKISFLDKFSGPLKFAVILFYESEPENHSQIQESLAKILVNFYPLAGRYIKNDQIFDCSDQGVEFVEAEALDTELIDLVSKIETDQLNSLLPDEHFRVDEAAEDPVMSIQATRFPSGGLAIAISVSHRLIDASSLGTFVAAWSNEANPNGKKLNRLVSFDLPHFLPNRDYVFSNRKVKQSTAEDDKYVVKRFSFNKEALTSLRSKISSGLDGGAISRVRVSCAVIAKALIGLDRAKLGACRDFVITQPVNMRERTTFAPQPKHSCGNLWMASITRRVDASEAEEVDLQELVDIIGEAVGKSIADYAELLSPERDGRDLIENGFKKFNKEVNHPETNVILFSDWSKFGFYEADFGWGRPVSTSIGPQRPFYGSCTILMSDKEGNGIEAWVHLKKKDMHYFEQDEEIKLICNTSNFRNQSPY